MRIGALMIHQPVLAAVFALFLARGLQLSATAATNAPDRAARPLPRVTPSGLPVPRFASLKSERVFVRQGPSNENAVSWVYVRKGWPVEVIAEQDVWRRIRDRDGQMGWIHSRLLDGTRTAVVQGTSMLALRRKPEEDGRPVAWAEPGVLVRLKRCEATWCEVEGQNSVEGWLERGALWGLLPGERIE
jgi:SH3-like domain-containing protein